ncbi:MAG: archaellin/type IV pilin N-terminal domain-containing protein [Candidatus Aenigmatarchaeota archaeon]
MEKGVSAVIATILMLVITIALAGMAYMYISGVFTGATQGIEIVDSYCTGGIVTIMIRNIGTSDISFVSGSCTISENAATCGSITVIRTSGGNYAADSVTGDTSRIEPGKTGTLKNTDCTGPKTCVYRIVPPIGKSIQASVFCA